MKKQYEEEFNFIGVALLAIGAMLFSWQVYLFLKQGTWTSYSVIDLLLSYTDIEWVYSPDDWLGLHQIFFVVFDFIGTSFLLLTIGITMIFYAGAA